MNIPMSRLFCLSYTKHKFGFFTIFIGLKNTKLYNYIVLHLQTALPRGNYSRTQTGRTNSKPFPFKLWPHQFRGRTQLKYDTKRYISTKIYITILSKFKSFIKIYSSFWDMIALNFPNLNLRTKLPCYFPNIRYNVIYIIFEPYHKARNFFNA